MTNFPSQFPYTDTNSGLHYDLRLDIDPSSRFLSIRGSIAYHSPTDRLERARFYLHRQFTVLRIEGRRILGYQFHQGQEITAIENQPAEGAEPPPFSPHAGILDIYFSPPLRRNETVIIQLEYQGEITDWPADSTSQISSDWVELGSHLPWFPIQFNGDPSELTFTLKVYSPPGMQVASYGRPSMLDGAWYFNWPYPTSDIVVAAGNSLRSYVFDSETSRVYIAASSFGRETATHLGEELLLTLERFSGWFGPARPGELTLIQSPRKLGGSYAHRGLIVLSGVSEQAYQDQRIEYLHQLACQAARIWWWGAPIHLWEDWLNESFAEYSALLVLREQFGIEAFEERISVKRARVNGGYLLWQFDRGDTSTPEKQTLVERMLHDQGPLILDNLARRIGIARFLELCRARLWSGVTSTDHLLDLIEELEDTGTRVWMESQLKRPGE